MTSKDWHQAWDDGLIGFHRNDINPLLLNNWPLLAAGQDETVLVPLSGKTVDMVWLARQHYRVYGSELVERAVKVFFSENGLQPVIRKTGDHGWWEAGNLTVIQGDFFTIPADSIDATVFYDRASLIAVPQDQHSHYVATLLSVAPTLRHGLLITLEYAPLLAGGPPYSVGSDNVETLYGNTFEVKQLSSAPPERIPSRMAGADVSSLFEHVFLLTRKADPS